MDELTKWQSMVIDSTQMFRIVVKIIIPDNKLLTLELRFPDWGENKLPGPVGKLIVPEGGD